MTMLPITPTHAIATTRRAHLELVYVECSKEGQRILVYILLPKHNHTRRQNI
jgi:hypothetical protein